MTKISIAALEALERDDYTRLPGGIFGRSFVRAYAQQVDLEADEVVEAFAGELAQAEREAARRKVRPEITADDRAFLERQQRALLVARRIGIVLAVIAAALLVWLAWRWWGPTTPEPVATPQAQVPVSSPPPPAGPPPPAETPAVEPAPVVSRNLAITFEVTSDCWVRIAADGQVVLERVITAGEKQSFTADHEVTLDVGNAGAFVWSVNGKPAKALGGRGAHRLATITRENVETFWQD